MSVLAYVQSAYADATNDTAAVEMVSYEQACFDDYGTIALKNNTSEDIHNVSFMLEYLDMEGKPMDYETFTYNIDIAPGMTKKLDIPAYEYSRHYHYYKTKDRMNNPAFKLRFEFKDYNISEKISHQAVLDEQIKNDSTKRSTNFFASSLMIILLLVILGIYVGMYVLVAVMAQKRNRNPVIWLLLSFIASPFLICLILLIIGYSNRIEY